MDSLIEEGNIYVELFNISEVDEEEATEFFLNLKREIEELEIEVLLNEEYDNNNAFVSIQAGTGGLDAQDWAQMLMRMYLKFFDKEGFKVKILDLMEDKEAGIKHVEILVEGQHAYGLIKSEAGVHRLVRISPYSASGKRQTSFASVDVSPEFDDLEEIEIRDEQLRIDTYRSSGAGGQHVNTTDSAVRITHLPTGIVVNCQNERSQIQNREMAMKVLYSKLKEKQIQENKEKELAIKGQSKTIAWGSQIRSYVLHPYTLVKDHRTLCEQAQIQKVLDGDLKEFIYSYLKWRADENS